MKSINCNSNLPEKRILINIGDHVCMMCGFKATTKNKYRELQDHLVRHHFKDQIKAALPTARPFMCPDDSCNVEGKDWQALMRHYTGKHGVLKAYLKEFLSSQIECKETLQFNGSIPPTTKIGCRRKRHKKHSSGSNSGPTKAKDSTEGQASILPNDVVITTVGSMDATTNTIPTVSEATCTTICGNGAESQFNTTTSNSAQFDQRDSYTKLPHRS